MKRQKTKQNGITLIGLVITIIVMLILAGISLNTLTGDNGILNQSKGASNKYKKASFEEKIDMALSLMYLYNNDLYETLSNELKDVTIEKITKECCYAYDDNNFLTVYKNKKREGYVSKWTGESEQPEKISDTEYNINTANQLYWIANNISSENSFDGITFYINNDLDLTARQLNDGSWDGTPWIPIGVGSDSADNQISFKGKIYGNEHIIRCIYINNENDYQGLFGMFGGELNDLTFETSYIRGNKFVGTVAGYSYDGKIFNCNNYCDVSGFNDVSGFFGKSSGNTQMRNCNNYGEIISNSYSGGMVGEVFSANISYCKNYGIIFSVKGTENIGYGAGGIVGNFRWGTITRCANYGEVIAEFWGAGGIIGCHSPYTWTISECCNFGTIKTGLHLGGIVGGSAWDTGSDLNLVIDCYNLGNLVNPNSSSSSKLGGIAGRSYRTQFTNCYNAGFCNVGYPSSSSYVVEGISISGDSTKTWTYTNTYVFSDIISDTEAPYAKTDEELSSEDMIEILNAGREDGPWVYNPNGFPKLSWEN